MSKNQEVDEKHLNDSVENEELNTESIVEENSNETEKNSTEQENLNEKIAELEKKNAELQDQYLRKVADFDN